MRPVLEHRADLDARVQAVADLEGSGSSTAASVNFFCDVLVDEESAGRDADLAVVAELAR